MYLYDIDFTEPEEYSIHYWVSICFLNFFSFLFWISQAHLTLWIYHLSYHITLPISNLQFTDSQYKQQCPQPIIKIGLELLSQ